MTEKEQIQEQVDNLEKQLEPLKERLREIYSQESQEVAEKIKRCEKATDKFLKDELRYAAYSRCPCGAGLAYPKNIGIHGAWYCSSILLGEAVPGTTHEAPKPFAFWEIKSEDQPSANGATTR